ncbi:MAG: 50S ribosomal protein L15 [Candidatus Saccharimonadales bacterium]
MKYHELQVVKPKAGKRVGRGIAAGQGKTAGRGTKGQGARTGSKAKPGFIGGSTPLMIQLPKLPGFKSKRTPACNVYTGQLNAFKGTVDNVVLAEAGLVAHGFTRVKLVVKGDLTAKLTVKLQGASASAIAAVEAAGGTFEKTLRAARPITNTAKAEKQSAKKA